MPAPAAAESGAGPHDVRRRLLAGLLAGALFLAIWLPLQPERELPPTADLYTHLTVARHLVRGDGYLTDVAYPLSFAFPFARRLPQPLIQRMPGFSTLLIVPHLTAGRDEARTIAHVQFLGALLLAAIAGLGVWGLLRSGRAAGAGLYLVLLGTSPLLGFAVAWGQDEVPAALLLLALWLVLRLSLQERPGLAGLLAGLTALVRLELLWVPLLWWLLLRGRNRTFWLMTATMLLVLMPWSLRTLRLTGQPFFTLQGVAELAKDTRTHPGYAIYRGLEPRPLLATLVEEPEPVARKAARGLRFFRDNLVRLLPWPWLVLLAVSPLAAARRRVAVAGGAGPPPAARAPLPAAVATLVLLILLYAVFDHSLRHLIPILPVVCWELSLALAGTGRSVVSGRAGGLAVLGLALALLLPGRLPGWEGAAAEAATLKPAVAAATAEARTAPADVLFFAYAAVPWFADRPGVWAPIDPATKAKIRAWLAAAGGAP